MKAWNIVVHSVGMLIRNAEQVLKIGLLPLLIVCAVVYAILSMGGFSMISLIDPEAMYEMLKADEGFAYLSLAVIIYMLGFLWIVISWHRFVLLEEYPKRWLPRFRLGPVLAYVGRFLMICLILGLFMFIIMFGLTSLGGIGSGGAVAVNLLYLLFMFVLSLAFYRFLPVLPAAAIGRPLKLSEAWAATNGATSTLIVVVLFAGLVNFMLSLLIGTTSMLTPFLMWPSLLIVWMLQLFFNASLMTTLYGHFVEGRSFG